jgi:hypothetical protein
MRCRRPGCNGLVICDRLPAKGGFIDFMHCIMCGEFYPESEGVYDQKVITRAALKASERVKYAENED